MSQLVILLGNTNDFVQIRLLERGPVTTPSEGDVRLGVLVHFDGFAGEYDQVWVGRDDWVGFLGAMRGLELTRVGVASLRSMSPDEFELHLQIVDRAGHLAAHGWLSRCHFGHPSGNTVCSRVEYFVDVDPGLLLELVGMFERL